MYIKSGVHDGPYVLCRTKKEATEDSLHLKDHGHEKGTERATATEK